MSGLLKPLLYLLGIGGFTMSPNESMYVALFLIVVVFFVLFCLFLCIKLFSFAVAHLESTLKGKKELVQKR